MKAIVRIEIDASLEEKLEEKLENFITKDEFYKNIDKVLSALDDLDERTIALEDIHPKGKHPLPALA